MTIGIVGGGQLGRMLALAGYPLGLDCLFLDRSDDTPAAQVAPGLVGSLDDHALLRRLAKRSDVLSFDWENASVPALRRATRGVATRIAPPLRALAVAQDRLSEKRLFGQLGIHTTRHAAVGSQAGLQRAVQLIGLPGVLKTRRLGYDGKGQKVLRTIADVENAWRDLGEVPLIYEEWISFDYEVSAIAVRDRRGRTAFYPLNRNAHAGGILRVTSAPWNDAALTRSARRVLTAVLRKLNYVGVLAVEFFVANGRLIANEMAPRVHNSGHWTIEGAVTSQFENHLRAITGLPLGDTSATAHAGMINLLGEVPPAASLLDVPGLHLHDYGKRPRPGRKVGHLTILRPTAAERDRIVRQIFRRIYPRGAIIL